MKGAAAVLLNCSMLAEHVEGAEVIPRQPTLLPPKERTSIPSYVQF